MSAGTILNNDLKIEDSHGRAVKLGDTIVVEMGELHWSDPDPYGDYDVYACSKKIFGKLHLRVSQGLMVKIEGIISGDEYSKDDIPLTDRKYIRLKVNKYNWYGIDADAKEAYEKELIMESLK